MVEKLDIHDIKKRLEQNLQTMEESDMSDKQKTQIKRFILEAQMGKNSSKRVGPHRICANINSFMNLHRYFKKDFEKISDKDVENFQRDLDNDKIRQRNGNVYTSNSKDELIRGLKRYLRWILPAEDYKVKAAWLKEYEEIPEIPAITLKEAEKLAKNAKYPRDKALIIFLFDSGCRIEEALNLRIKDIEKKEKDDGDEFYIVDVKVSKTLPRKISIPIATPTLSDWLSQHPAITDKEAYLFPITYDAVRMMLARTAKEVLDKHITAHQLRHSSATYYCKVINNPYKFCYRYGWTINSDQSKRYIDRNLLGDEAQEELDNLIKNSKVQDFEKEVNKVKMESDKKMNLMTKELENVKSLLAQLIEDKK